MRQSAGASVDYCIYCSYCNYWFELIWFQSFVKIRNINFINLQFLNSFFLPVHTSAAIYNQFYSVYLESFFYLNIYAANNWLTCEIYCLLFLESYWKQIYFTHFNLFLSRLKSTLIKQTKMCFFLFLCFSFIYGKVLCRHEFFSVINFFHLWDEFDSTLELRQFLFISIIKNFVQTNTYINGKNQFF